MWTLSLPVVYMNLMQTFPQFLPLKTTLQTEMFNCLHQYVSESWEKPNVNHPMDTSRIATLIFDDWKSTSRVQEVDWSHVKRFFSSLCSSTWRKEICTNLLGSLFHIRYAFQYRLARRSNVVAENADSS